MIDTPTKPMPTAKAALIPAMYAAKTPGSWAAVKTDRSCVAPVATSVAGLTLGALV